MANHNASRNQANQRRSRAHDAREMKSSTKQARTNGGTVHNSNTPTNGHRRARAQGGQHEETSDHSVLRDAKKQVGQIAHQATDIASNATKVTTQAVIRASRATGGALGKAGEAALEMARAHPVPLALTGIGLACAGIGISWLIAANASGASRSSQTSSDGQQSDGRSAGVKAIKTVAHDATAKVSDLAHRASAHATQLEQQLETMIKEHPIAAGATLLVVGAAIGLAVPRTALEDSWIGHERDRLMTSARNLVQTVIDKGKVLAEQVMPDAMASNNAHA